MRSRTSKTSTIRRWRHYVVIKCDCHLYKKNPGEIPHCFLPMKLTVRNQWILYNHWKNGFTSNLTTTILCLELWYIKLCYLYITYFIDTQSKTNNIPFSSELNVTNLFILFFCLHNVYLSKTTAKLQRPNSLPYIHFFSILLPAHSIQNELIPNSLSSSWVFSLGILYKMKYLRRKMT